MSLEEIFAQAILTGGVTILNCSVVIGSNAQVSDFLQNTAASTPNLKVDQEIKVDPRLKTEKAALIWKTLTENKYIHTEGSWYVWDRTQAEYGYMVYIVSDILGVKQNDIKQYFYLSDLRSGNHAGDGNVLSITFE